MSVYICTLRNSSVNHRTYYHSIFYLIFCSYIRYILYITLLYTTTLYYALKYIPYIILITIYYAPYNLTTLFYPLQATVNCLRAAKSNKAHTLHDLATSMLDRIVQIAGIVFYLLL